MAASSPHRYPHRHPLHLVQYDSHNKWRCNICSKSYSAVTDSKARYRCTSCDNFNACSDCSYRHRHQLTLVTTPTRWRCDSCKSIFHLSSPRYRCITCTDYDRCQSCYATQPHPHDLKLMNITHGKNWGWRCDNCRVLSRGLPNEPTRYKCHVCPDFDFCDRCYRSKHHRHPLKLITNAWVCDECLMPNGSKRYRCSTCDDYDRCETCHNKVRHPHRLNLVTYSNIGGWCCDRCDVAFYAQNDAPRYRCCKCVDYDLCPKCFGKRPHRHPVKRVSSPSSWFCDSCRASLNWSQARYRCTSCKDYDICSLCYEGQMSPSLAAQCHSDDIPRLTGRDVRPVQPNDADDIPRLTGRDVRPYIP